MSEQTPATPATPAGPAGPAEPGAPAKTARKRSATLDTMLVTLLSVVAALVIGAILIAIGDPATRGSFKYFFSYPGDTLRFAWDAISQSYVALFEGAIFNPNTASKGTTVGILGPISETLTYATPLIAGGLSVGLAFRAGLFNIGGQGQIIAGATCAGFVGFHWDLPPVIHVVAAVIAGILGGAFWGGITGFLKARTGAHEVITTIMLNYIALDTLRYLLSVKGFQAPPYGQAISNKVEGNARLPHLFGGDMRVHLGLLLSLAAAALVWWLLTRSRLGFRLRAVGANPVAAKTAGMSVENSYLVVMLIAGALAGLAGSYQILGTNSQITDGIDAGIGFDAITVALLGRANPLGTVFAGLLFGALHAGQSMMQQHTPVELVQVLQSMIVLFIAAPAVIRAVFRLRTSGSDTGAELAKGWNG